MAEMYIHILVINGPNLNLLGKLNRVDHGELALADIENLLHKRRYELETKDVRILLDFRQSNHEGDLITWVGETVAEEGAFDGIIINPSTLCASQALADALQAVFDNGLGVPAIEVHLSQKDIKSTRPQSLTEQQCVMTRYGEHDDRYDEMVYTQALEYLFKDILERRKTQEKLESADNKFKPSVRQAAAVAG